MKLRDIRLTAHRDIEPRNSSPLTLRKHHERNKTLRTAIPREPSPLDHHREVIPEKTKLNFGVWDGVERRIGVGFKTLEKSGVVGVFYAVAPELCSLIRFGEGGEKRNCTHFLQPPSAQAQVVL